MQLNIDFEVLMMIILAGITIQGLIISIGFGIMWLFRMIDYLVNCYYLVWKYRAEEHNDK